MLDSSPLHPFAPFFKMFSVVPLPTDLSPEVGRCIIREYNSNLDVLFQCTSMGELRFINLSFGLTAILCDSHFKEAMIELGLEVV